MYPGDCNWTEPFLAVCRETGERWWWWWGCLRLSAGSPVKVELQSPGYVESAAHPPQPIVLMDQLPLRAAPCGSAHWIMRSRRLITSCDGLSFKRKKKPSEARVERTGFPAVSTRTACYFTLSVTVIRGAEFPIVSSDFTLEKKHPTSYRSKCTSY